jgi:hypothetical protein
MKIAKQMPVEIPNTTATSSLTLDVLESKDVKSLKDNRQEELRRWFEAITDCV